MASALCHIWQCMFKRLKTMTPSISAESVSELWKQISAGLAGRHGFKKKCLKYACEICSLSIAIFHWQWMRQREMLMAFSMQNALFIGTEKRQKHKAELYSLILDVFAMKLLQGVKYSKNIALNIHFHYIHKNWWQIELHAPINYNICKHFIIIILNS